MIDKMENSTSTHAGYDDKVRNKKAMKLLGILGKAVNLKECDLLDIGTGSGHIAHLLSKHCKSVTSVNLVDERVIKGNYNFVKTDGEGLPFQDESFDVAVSNHVIEHVSDRGLHVNEIHRVLKKGGIVYLATPNKYAFIEPHFKLPFLSMLPRNIAAHYLKFIKGKEWDVFPLSYDDIQNLTTPLFTIEDLSIKLIKNPKEYNLDMFIALQPLLKIMPTACLSCLRPILPSYIFILKKKDRQ